ncbi:RNA polymerase sigma factor [Marinobacter alexandrii]|jgi:RNA polymerase sigma-70 factor, ECF subfamily|uniref:RNA polymerase sigma factor n=1 Tax=Marinobacter TaxID=2742 RepID=UPI001FFFFE7F|nr:MULTISPECIES: RNA polymerase sigma factor [Marinobacter]MCK2149416.1 RNA polymerase sigma factor [Marinobacter alexandrii]
MSDQRIEQFLASVERRAYRMARLATRNDADALDIVQDAMMKLATNYGDRSEEEWKPLFYRILERRILDWHRRESVRNRWFFWRKGDGDDEDQQDVTENASDGGAGNPYAALAFERSGQAVMEAIEALPLKQQQCFLLRCWEGLSVQETADIMGVNPGSVKTHAHRALQKLTRVIEHHGHE